MKKWWFMLIIFILMLGSANAFYKEKSIEWLNKTVKYDVSTAEEAAFSLLALKSNNAISKDYSGHLAFQQKKDEINNCFSKSSCNAKDTALASLVNSNFNLDNSNLLKWLDSLLTKADIEDWYIQINTINSGKCTILYDEGQIKIVEVDGTNKLKIENEAGEFDWIDVKTNLQLNFDKSIEEVIIDCSKPLATKISDPGMLISLLRIVDNKEYYIVQESKGNKATLKINNACYSDNLNGQCSKEASFYTAWVLKKLGKTQEQIKVIPYLQKNAVDDKDYAILFGITNDPRYAQFLVDNQNILGYWGNKDIVKTSFAVNALEQSTLYKEQVDSGKKWLESQQTVDEQANNGSFNKDVLDTATATYLVFTKGTLTTPPTSGISICGDGIKEGMEECDDNNKISGDDCSSGCKIESSECTKNSDCNDLNKICDNRVCISKCNSDEQCLLNQKCVLLTGKCEARAICGDGRCDVGESKTSCSEDCSEKVIICTEDSDCSSDETCDTSTGECKKNEVVECKEDNECDEGEVCDNGECKEKSGLGVLFWASLVIITAILAVGGYFAYHKFLTKPKFSQPSYLPRQPAQQAKPRYSQGSHMIQKKSNVDENLEKELDKSIKEAERLLKK